MASLDSTTRLDPPPLHRPRMASSDRVAFGAIAGGVLGGLAGLVSGADAGAVELGVTVLGTTYAGLAGGGLLGWLAGLGRLLGNRGRRAAHR